MISNAKGIQQAIQEVDETENSAGRMEEESTANQHNKIERDLENMEEMVQNPYQVKKENQEPHN